MKHLLSAIVCIVTFSVVGNSQCRENLDKLGDRARLLEQVDSILKTSIPAYAQYPEGGFFVYDLTDPTQFYRSPTDSRKEYGCINFVNNHIYHFSTVDYEKSDSHIAILENGKLKVFRSINCESRGHDLLDVISYIKEKLKNNKHETEILTRLKNYRRYGLYLAHHGDSDVCRDAKPPENSDKLYDRSDILYQFSDILQGNVSTDVQEQFPQRVFVEVERANGFFVYDLTDPSNKQTSLLERVEFKNNHIYHFAYIDLPFSFSNLAVLEDGKLKIFKSINCEGKGDSLVDALSYLNRKVKNDKNKDEIIQRVKNYRSYGVYASFNGLSTPQCEELIKIK